MRMQCLCFVNTVYCFVSIVFIHNDQLLRGSLSIKGEVERREQLVGMFSMSEGKDGECSTWFVEVGKERMEERGS